MHSYPPLPTLKVNSYEDRGYAECVHLKLLSRLGLAMSDDGLRFALPHTIVAEEDALYGLALIAASLHAPLDVIRQFESVRLSELVFRCLHMDSTEAQVMSILDGRSAMLKSRTAESFNNALLEIISSHRLWHLFGRGADGEFHRNIHPLAYDDRLGKTVPEEMPGWRADFRAMSLERQIMAATIIWLYRSGADSTWLQRVPSTWPATDALSYLFDAGCLTQWLRLVSSYLGW